MFHARRSSVSAGDSSVIQQMESLRTNVPPPRTLSEYNGFSIKDIGGGRYLLTHLSGVAERLRVEGRQDMIVLMSYLKDEDTKIRYIAATARKKKLRAFPGGMSLRDITDTGSDGHARMVAAFAKGIVDLPPAGGQPVTAGDHFTGYLGIAALIRIDEVAVPQ